MRWSISHQILKLHYLLIHLAWCVIFSWKCNFMYDNELKDLGISLDIHNLVSTPTFYKSDSGTLVDVCLVSKLFRFKTTLNLDCCLSDFQNFICVTTKLSLSKRQPIIIQYRSYKNFVEELFVIDLCILSQTMMHYSYLLLYLKCLKGIMQIRFHHFWKDILEILVLIS